MSHNNPEMSMKQTSVHMTREEFRAVVITEVRAKLANEPWFKGVNMDDTDEFYPGDIDEAIETAYFNTMYWDAPNHGGIK